MKKITDERLILRNLKNIRIAFMIENLAIILFLIYEVYSGEEFSDVFTNDNPLFVILMIGCFTLTFLSFSISVQMEGKEKMPEKLICILSLAVFTVVTVINLLIPGGVSLPVALLGGVITGGVVFGIMKYMNKYRG